VRTIEVPALLERIEWSSCWPGCAAVSAAGGCLTADGSCYLTPEPVCRDKRRGCVVNRVKRGATRSHRLARSQPGYQKKNLRCDEQPRTWRKSRITPARYVTDTRWRKRGNIEREDRTRDRRCLNEGLIRGLENIVARIVLYACTCYGEFRGRFQIHASVAKFEATFSHRDLRNCMYTNLLEGVSFLPERLFPFLQCADLESAMLAGKADINRKGNPKGFSACTEGISPSRCEWHAARGISLNAAIIIPHAGPLAELSRASSHRAVTSDFVRSRLIDRVARSRSVDEINRATDPICTTTSR